MPTCYWPDEIIAKSHNQFFKDNLKDGKERCEEEWEKLMNFLSIYPDFFDPSKLDKYLYLWALGFVQSRAFGWGLPATMLVPLADCLNHNCTSPVSPDILEKNLHKSMNKIYLYKHNFEEVQTENEDTDKVYDKSSSKMKIICPKLFKEDELAELPQEILQSWRDADQLSKDDKQLYSRDLCKQRFLFNQRKHKDPDSEEQKFEGDDEEFGMQLWGIGYISSDWNEDRDDAEYLEDESDLLKEAELMEKIRSDHSLTPSQMDEVADSTRLSDIYNTRWWKVQMQSYFVHYNGGQKPLKENDQAFYMYGSRSDDYLLESYGFCLEPNQNPFSSWKFRVLIGVNPAGEIEEISEMVPPKAVRDDRENIDKLTDLISVQSHRISEPLMEYLRTTMNNHYSEIGGSDAQYLMISSPRVIEFELLILDWGIKLLEHIAKDELFRHGSLD